MSYDVDLDGGSPAFHWNYTSNVSPMWHHAGLDLRACHGRDAGGVAEGIAGAIIRMQADPGTYRNMNPPNGWGDYDGCLAALKRLLNECMLFPKATVRVWS